MEMILTIVIKCIVIIFSALATYYLIPTLKKNNLYNIVVTLVQAAEQIYKESNMGEIKYQYVLNILQKKFNMKEEDLRCLIESAVYELNQNFEQ